MSEQQKAYCHACGEEILPTQGELAHCLGYRELSQVLIHSVNVKPECKAFIMTAPCAKEPERIIINADQDCQVEMQIFGRREMEE